MTIDELNQLDGREFVERVGWVCENSPWVAERAWPAAPFSGIEELHSALLRQVHSAPEPEKLALLNAHPDLGTRAQVSAASASEQQGAGLDQLTAEEFHELISLNERYRREFGFPFLFAVKGSTKHQILTSMRDRIDHRREEELEEALRQTARIIRFRLESILDDQNR